MFLHLQRRQGRLILAAEHRSAPPFGPVGLELVHPDGGHPHLQLVSLDDESPGSSQPDADALRTRIVEMLSESDEPRSVAQLCTVLRVRNQRLVEAVRQLTTQGRIRRLERGYTLAQRS